MKFICQVCDKKKPCILRVPKNISFTRDDYEVALRRCPFEDTIDDELIGKSPMAKWERVSK